MRPFLLVLLTLAPLAVPVAAQPSGEALLAAWRRGWSEAARGVEGVTFTEDVTRRIEGPREGQTLRSIQTVRIDRNEGITRDVQRAALNGRPIARARLAHLERRLDRAYAPGYGWLEQPVFLTERLMRLLEPTRPPVPDRLGPRRALRLETTVQARTDRFERVTLWFAPPGPGQRPRLLRARLIGAMPRGGSAVIETDYVAVEGLDLPERTTVEVVLPQRRRQRVFTILLTADLRFQHHDLLVP